MVETATPQTAQVIELAFGFGKSMNMLPGVSSLSFDADGNIVGDRQLMWVDAETGLMITGRNHKGLGEMTPLILPDDNSIAILTPDEADLWVPEPRDVEILDVTMWRPNETVWAQDMGERAAAWGSKRIVTNTGKPTDVRLVRAIPGITARRPNRNPNWPEVSSFVDGYPVTITTRASNDAVNAMLKDMELPTADWNNSRTTITIDGLEAFQEDTIASFGFAAGDAYVTFMRRKASGRCVMTEKKQGGDVRVPGFLKALAELGRLGTHLDTERFGNDQERFFAQNYTVHIEGDVPKGQVITLPLGAQLDVGEAVEQNWVPNAA
jgi:uncharacterized protein YcbX